MLPMFFRGTPKLAKAVAEPKRVTWQQGDFTVNQAEEQNQTIIAPEKLIIRDIVWKKADILVWHRRRHLKRTPRT